MAKRKVTKRKSKKTAPPPKKPKMLFLVIGFGVVAAIVGAIWAFSRETVDLGDFSQGPVNNCRTLPAFTSEIGFSNQVLIDTTQQSGTGVVLHDAASGELYQHPTWDDAGNLGAYTLNEAGDIFAAPFPLVSLYENDPEAQNTIQRIDTHTIEMQPFVKLPRAQPVSAQNPFGVLGLTYDCDTHSLYAASVAGSGIHDEIGQIYRIDPQNGDILDQISGVDAIGLGVFNGSDGKRLYFGKARSPELFSIQLDADGNFYGEPRLEFNLAVLAGGSFDKVQTIRFRQNIMTLKGIEFNFSLLAQSDIQRNIYTFEYNFDSAEWFFLDVN